MEASKTRSSRSRQLRHSDTAIERARKDGHTNRTSHTKQRVSNKSPPESSPDLEPVKKRLRSAGDYRMSSPVDDPDRPRHIPKSSSPKKSPTKSASTKAASKPSPNTNRKPISPHKTLPPSSHNNKTSPPRKSTIVSDSKSPRRSAVVMGSNPTGGANKKSANVTFKSEQSSPDASSSPPTTTTTTNQRASRAIAQSKKDVKVESPSKSSSSSTTKSYTSSKPTAVKKEANQRRSSQQLASSSSRRPIKLELPETVASTSQPVKTPRNSIRFFEPDTPPIRNQNVFHSCNVCKEPTLLLTAEHQEQLAKNEVKNVEFNAEDLLPHEDPALQCSSCRKHFHLVCVYDAIELQNWALSNAKAFVCQECVRCARCLEPIFDPGNVQCITCGQAYHEVCKPETKISHDFPSLSRIWYCSACEESLLNILEFGEQNGGGALKDGMNVQMARQQPATSRQQRPNKRNAPPPSPPKKPTPRRSNKEQPSELITKKARIDVNMEKSPEICSSRTLRRLSSRLNSDTSPKTKTSPAKVLSSPNRLGTSPAKSTKPASSPPKSIESPSRANNRAGRDLTDDELEKRRLAGVQRLKDSIRYEGEFQCIAAQESTFSRLNEEYVDEEEDEIQQETRLEHFLPFASVGHVSANSAAKRAAERADVTFFYGNTAYKPRFSQFLRLVYADYERLSFCRRCLMALPSPCSLAEHSNACTVTNPPGTLIYRENNISVWEVVGQREKTYSRRLALFAKTFIGSKTVFFEVEQFNFYVLTENEGPYSVMAGYFSKEIKPTANNNLSCLLILPWVQRKGYGLFLIDLSYHLSMRERKIGSPEHPLSDAGLKTYRQYWYAVIMSFLREKIYHNERVDLMELKEQKGIDMRDILETLIVADMTFILDDKLQINVETPLYTMLSSLRRRYVKPKLLQIKAHAGPFSSYN